MIHVLVWPAITRYNMLFDERINKKIIIEVSIIDLQKEQKYLEQHL